MNLGLDYLACYFVKQVHENVVISTFIQKSPAVVIATTEQRYVQSPPNHGEKGSSMFIIACYLPLHQHNKGE